MTFAEDQELQNENELESGDVPEEETLSIGDLLATGEGNSSTLAEEAEEAEEEEEEADDAADVEPTRVPFYKTGYAKLGLVAGISFIVVAGVTSLYTGLFSGAGSNTVVLEEESPPPEATPFTEEPQNEQVQKAQQEASEAKAKLALAEQRNRLAAANAATGSEGSANNPTVTPSPTPVATVEPAPMPSPEPSPVATVPPPPPPPPPAAAPPPPPPLIPPPPAIEAISKPPEDPMVRWTKMSRLGQFSANAGSASAGAVAGAGASGGVLSPPRPSQMYQPIYARSPEAAPPPPSPSVQRPRSQRPPLTAGTTGKGRLLSSVIWAGDIDITQDTYAIQLTKPLGSIPNNAVILARPVNVSSAGLIRFMATKIQLPEGGEVSIPEGAIMIGGSGGNFLQARYVNRGQPGLFADLFSSVLAGGRQVAALVNRPEVSTTISNTTGSVGPGGSVPGSSYSQVINNPEPDYAAAFAEGALTRLTESLDRRVQTRSNAQPFFEVAKGKEVDILVLRDVAL